MVFLCDLHSCLGKGVPSKQELICDLIFGNGDGVMDETSAGVGAVVGGGTRSFGARPRLYGDDARRVDHSRSFYLSSASGHALVDRQGTEFIDDTICGVDVIWATREPPVDQVASGDVGLQLYIGDLPSYPDFVSQFAEGQPEANTATGTHERDLRRAYIEKVNETMEHNANLWVDLRAVFARSSKYAVRRMGRGGFHSRRSAVHSAPSSEGVEFPGVDAAGSTRSARAASLSAAPTTTDADRFNGVAEYFLAMLRLYAEMCLNRNYVCITVVTRMFSRRALFTTMKHSGLHQALRAAACRLLLAAYVDVQPMEELLVAERPRLWQHLSHQPKLPRQRFAAQLSADDVKFFEELREFLIEYLAVLGGRMVASNQAANTLTLAILAMTYKMLAFGFFFHSSDGERGELTLARMAAPLLLLVDGRNDVETTPGLAGTPAGLYHRGGTPAAAASVMGRGSRRHAGHHSKFHSHHSQQYQGADHARASADTWRRYETASRSPLLMECKAMACQILTHVTRLRIHLQLSSVLRVFVMNRSLFASVHDRIFQPVVGTSRLDSLAMGLQRFNSSRRKVLGRSTDKQYAQAMKDVRLCVDGSALHLKELGAPTFMATLLDLLMYRHAELTKVALELLVQHREHFHLISKALDRVQLITDPATAHVLRRARRIMPDLRQYAEASEMWLNMRSNAHKGTAKRVRYMIGLLTDMMWASFGTHKRGYDVRGLDEDDVAEELESSAAAQQAIHKSPSIAEQQPRPPKRGSKAKQQGQQGGGMNGHMPIGERRVAEEAARLQEEAMNTPSLRRPELDYGGRYRAPPHERDTVDDERQALMRNMHVPELVLTLMKDATSMWRQREWAHHLTQSFTKGVDRLFAVCYRYCCSAGVTAVASIVEHVW